MGLTLLCVSSLVLTFSIIVTGQNTPIASTSINTPINTPINPTWTGVNTWNTNPAWGGNTMWNSNNMFNRPFYPNYPQYLQGRTVYCYPINQQPLYRSFAAPIGPIEEIGSTFIGGKKK